MSEVTRVGVPKLRCAAAFFYNTLRISQDHTSNLVTGNMASIRPGQIATNDDRDGVFTTGEIPVQSHSCGLERINVVHKG